ncbi:MAG: hypothetical protein IJ946_04000 [Clostridia bacterium]|nr:hypothetical protein [Clostridia bacterium]
MTKNNILKNAFIDAQLDSRVIYTYDFSAYFNEKMQRIIKMQKGFGRLINTASKRAACIVLAIILCFTTVACSVKEIREPVFEEIKRIVVNAKELLRGTAAHDVAYLFPTDIIKIVGTSHISENKNQYYINEKEKITSFIKLLSETQWGSPKQFEEFEKANIYWSFDFYNSNGERVLEIKMCNDTAYERSKIAIIKDGEENHFYISNKIYNEILAFTNQKYYLHNSPVGDIDDSFFIEKKKTVFKGMNEEYKREAQKRIRSLHYEMEHFLMSNVSLLKEGDSIYWEYVINENIFIDPISGLERKYDINRIFRYEMEYLISVVEDKRTKESLIDVLTLYEQAVAEHNLSALFKVHEYIHDYDYFAFNFPTHYVYSEDADYQGINDYFGKLG